MFKIKLYNNISPLGLAQFSDNQYQIGNDIDNPDAILLRSQSLHETAFPQSLKAIARAGAGVNNIPIESLTAQGIPVFNTPGANANAVKELVIAAMLLASRNICQAWNYAHGIEASDTELTQHVEQGKKQYVGFELPGKRLAVIGLGAIGVKVANAAAAMGLEVIGYDPGITIQRAWELSADVKKAHSITEAITQADFVSLHVPYSEKTKHLVNSSLFQAMKPGVTLINCARGGIVDEDSLATALNNETVRCYVTDFPSNKLKEMNNVIMLPHLGASTAEAEENCAIMAASQLIDFLENGNIVNSVNFPEVTMPRTDGFRIAIANRNIPNMVGQISTDLAQAGLNIVDMINKSRGDVAYTLLDVDKPVADSVIEKIQAIDGILKVIRL